MIGRHNHGKRRDLLHAGHDEVMCGSKFGASRANGLFSDGFHKMRHAHLRRRTATFTYLPSCMGYDLSKNLYAFNQLSKFLNFCSFEELQPVRVTRPQEKTQPQI